MSHLDKLFDLHQVTKARTCIKLVVVGIVEKGRRTEEYFLSPLAVKSSGVNLLYLVRDGCDCCQGGRGSSGVCRP